METRSPACGLGGSGLSVASSAIVGKRSGANEASFEVSVHAPNSRNEFSNRVLDICVPQVRAVLRKKMEENGGHKLGQRGLLLTPLHKLVVNDF